MKRIALAVLAGLFAALSLAGCGKAPEGGGKEYCFDYRIRAMATGGSNSVMETEDSVYFLLNGMIYMSDKEYKDFMPLCVRPDCMHDDINCNAYSDAVNMTVYGSCIYYVDGFYARNLFKDGKYIEYLAEYSYEDIEAGLHAPEDFVYPALWRMQLDGTAHEKLLDLPVPETDFIPDVNGWPVFFTDKYLVFACSQTDGLGHSAFDLFVLDLDTLEYRPVSAEAEEFGLSGISPMAGKGDKLCCYSIDTDAYAADGTRIVYACELDCTEAVLKRLGVMEAENIYPEFNYYIEDNALYYIGHTGGEDARIQLYKFDLESGEAELQLSTRPTEMTWCEFDWQNGLLFTDQRRQDAVNERGIYFCSLEGETLDKHIYTDAELNEIKKIMMFFQTESYIFGTGPDKNGAYNSQNAVPDWYIDKADIGTGDLMWKRWGD